MNVVEFVKKELVEFTGLSRDLVDIYVKREKYPNFNEEWKFWKPDSNDNIRWFYISSRGYLFGNAIHFLAKDVLDDIKKGSSVLDFGGGSGNYSFELHEKGCKMYFFDINILQKEFVKYVSKKYNFDITICESDSNFYPILQSKVDNIIALDVLEHVPNYHKYIEMFSKNLNSGGFVYLFAPFGKSNANLMHLEDTVRLNKVLKDNGFVYCKSLNLHNIAQCLVFKIN
jgi:2-polyprenyl-3-methyl-5-hydroxy-6-metoxy-1,4-benzoquinol methylase